MASVIIYGDSSGQIDVKATAVAGTTTITTLGANTILTFNSSGTYTG